MVDYSKMKLGRRPSPYDPRTLRLAKYLKTLPPLPAKKIWSAKATEQPWGMMANDNIGDCTCAGAGHAIQVWTANAGLEVTLKDEDIISAYSAISGYDPSRPETDNGACLLDVLSYWRNTGIGGHKIGAYVSVNPQNWSHVRAAINIFGGLYTAAELPLTAQTQPVWQMTGWGTQGQGLPGSWGGHCIFVPDFDFSCETTVNNLTCITWGELKNMTADWWANYIDEVYAVISTDFLNQTTAKNPDGLDLDLLKQDLAQVAG